jgi:hypothetical protein
MRFRAGQRGCDVNRSPNKLAVIQGARVPLRVSLSTLDGPESSSQKRAVAGEPADRSHHDRTGSSVSGGPRASSRIARTEGWAGYFGAPAFATAAMGAQEFLRSSERLIDVALQILDGLDARAIPRYADEMDPLNVIGEQAQLDYETAVEKRQSDWLKSRKLR